MTHITSTGQGSRHWQSATYFISAQRGILLAIAILMAGAGVMGSLVSLRLQDAGYHPTLIGRSHDEAVDSWVFSGGEACVKDVVVGGEIVVEDRRHSREEEILRDFRAAIARLRARQ